jgi:hypothetical protein
MELLLCHLVGDYVLQSDWMALEKTKKTIPAIVHAFVYTLPFCVLTQSPGAIAFILFTHFLIDRWRLARYVGYAKNFLSPWWQEKEVITEAVPVEASLVVTPADDLFKKLLQNGQPGVGDPCPSDMPKKLGMSIGGRAKVAEKQNAWWYPWKECVATGYHYSRPQWLVVWLMFITDNTMHLLCNYAALRYFS